MKERPIIFNGEMVRAILDGRKTQTRRLVKRPINDINIGCELSGNELAAEIASGDYSNSKVGMPGDRLWVRETHAFVPEPAYRCSTGIVQTVNPGDDYQASIYRENFDRSSGGIRWRPSIHMPRWACRILLEITDVRVELLNDISEQDARAEGVTWSDGDRNEIGLPAQLVVEAKDEFARLWQSIYGEESWRSNPWVWVIEFKRVEGGAA